MSMMPLELGKVELAGMNLIEASAGTGKTYAIASLYLRLLIEAQLKPEQILVVTYTEAATQELRLRVRSRIREALEVMQGGFSEDPFLIELFHLSELNGREEAIGHLEEALALFDTAAIFTIHGFSLRALQENAFESGSLYDTELVKEQNDLLREIVDDFWRHHFFCEHPPLLAYALQKRCTPESLMKLLRELYSAHGGEVIPQYSVEEIQAIEEGCAQAFNDVAHIWRNEGEAVKLLLLEDKGLSRAADTYRQDLLPVLFEKMDTFVSNGNPLDLFDGFMKFAHSSIIAGTKSKKQPPEHSFFLACEALNAFAEERFIALKSELLQYCIRNLPLRKRRANIRFFDDLLSDLYHALTEGGESLAASLRQQYRAALIDEFQDTDPVQYEIFRAIYGAAEAPLFLIGDPKQAIYSFRGADIFAYMRAAAEVHEARRFTLTSNWRSHPALLHAFNTIFHSERNPFLYKGIVYHPLASGNGNDSGFSGDGNESATEHPMQICFMDPQSEGGTLNIGSAESFAAEASAVEIAKLLSEGNHGNSFPADRPIVAGDIAVIVRTHRQARLVQLRLRARGVAGVMQSNETVFASKEAEEVRVLLSAISEPRNEPLVRAALVTDMLGRSGCDIDRLNGDEPAWIECLNRFSHLHQLWLDRGFMAMASELMITESVRGRLLSFADGERRLTNLLHCFELLHREGVERGLGVEGLASWFSERIMAKECDDDYQIRLESDEAAVRIVTVHVSKGLEYPVVFCPFLFGGIKISSEVVQFHDDRSLLVKDFGSHDMAEHLLEAEKELLAENLRLLYVALTRAKYRCYLYTGRVVDGRKKELPLLSPLTWLFHVSDEAKGASELIIAANESIRGVSAEEMRLQLERVAEHSLGAIGVRVVDQLSLESGSGERRLLPAGQEAFTPVIRTFSGVVESEWRVSSFTSFSRHEWKPTELPDRDESEGLAIAAATQLPDGERTIFSFPRGARSGIMMHAIFEKLDFAAPSDELINRLAKESLERQGFESEWHPALCSMLSNVLRTPLSSGGGHFTLGSLKPGSWVTELEFFLPLRFLTSKALGEVLVRYGAVCDGDLAGMAALLDFKAVKGMLMGFIDMVFEHEGRYYLLDWKSNHLGNSVAEYRYDAMRRAMEENLYALQYLLYTVALNRYLSLKVSNYRYAEHFGGVIYVFLRGVHPAEGESSGFFRALPPEELIEALTATLAEEGGESDAY
jgi:exodeoxyribonuclease V beta subunit